MWIDVHCHYAPIEYLELLRGRSDFPRVEMRDGKHFLTNAQGTGHIIPAKIYDIETKLRDMDAAGVDMQVLGLIVPGCERVEAEPCYKASENS